MSDKILVVDDELLIRQSLRDVFEYEGYSVEEAENGKQALEKLGSTSFTAIFCDIKMPGMDGTDILGKAQSITDSPFIMISGHGDIETAVECIKKGAFDYLSKPLDLNRVLITLRNAKEKSLLHKETLSLKKQVAQKYGIIGNSDSLLEMLKMADRAAATSARILICGESGTGKELIARRIHWNSEYSLGPWVTVNCAAIPSELIESELFGHEKGAFTSAVKQRKGSFEQADGGSLFLDEIGDMSLSAQAKVLRTLQENYIMRVGGEKKVEVNVRVIAATNKDLQKEISEGRFREDLYHRLSVVLLKVPPLRERKDDIPLLIKAFVDEISSGMGKAPISFTQEAMDVLIGKTWSGNIRELRNVVERLMIFCDKTVGFAEVEKYI